MTGRRVANDPARRDRIAEAALAVIIEHGVHRTTHRKIAEKASVPLGSVTYYFGSLDDVICAAFEGLIAAMSARYATALDAAENQDAACDAVTELICGDSYASQRELVAIYEMYSYANHSAEARRMMAHWVDLSRVSLSRHFSPQACSAIDALVEGWPIHRSLAPAAFDRDVVRRTIGAIAQALP
jgi:DNA-binding transcriptional regulator YbjK